MLKLIDVLYFFHFFLEFISGLVAEISDFNPEIQRNLTDL
jgi:hypothetical protein